MSGSALRGLAGPRTWCQSLGRAWDSWGLSCLVSVGAAEEGKEEGQGRVLGVCLCVAAFPSCRARGMGEGSRIPLLQAHGD